MAPYDADFIFGIHGSGGEHYMFEAGKPGWILFSEAIGHNPNDQSSRDYSPFSDQGLTVVGLLVHGLFPDGTLPLNGEYPRFARRCAAFVEASRGCHVWIIGNEMNYAAERPGIPDSVVREVRSLHRDNADPYLHGIPARFNALLPANVRTGGMADPLAESGQAIPPESYARCFRLCREAIRSVAGHEDDRVLIGAVAPWNTHTTYPGNPGGDWITYFQDLLHLIGPGGCDGVTIHSATHGSNASLIGDEKRLQRFPQYSEQFRHYRDFMSAIPANMRQLPVLISQANQGQAWTDQNLGWIQAAYAEIDRWNRRSTSQKIRALILHRWPQIDRWHIEGKRNVIEDFRSALRNSYRWARIQGERDSEPSNPVGSRSPRSVLPDDLPPGPPYRVQWLKGQVPRRLDAGTTATVTIRARNVGVLPWPRAGLNPVMLSYRLYQNQEELDLSPEQRLRTPLPHAVQPGESITLDAEIALPAQPGNYTLHIDMLHDGVTWFGDQGSDVLARWVTLVGDEASEPPAPAQQDDDPGEARPETGVEPPIQIDEPIGPVPLPARIEQPEIRDISGRLPRGTKEYESRSLDDVRYIVINHTAAPPVVPVESIASAHIRGGYPGIAYEYFVRQSGELQQVSSLDRVVAASADWSGKGINIGLEGNFDLAPPPPAQIQAVAHLCAWLLVEYGLPLDAVVGLSELIETNGPGLTFLQGPAWKYALRSEIGELLTSSAPAAVAPRSEPTPLNGDDKGDETDTYDRDPAALLPEPDSDRIEAPRPLMQDIIGDLPRNHQGFFRRNPEDVEFIVINHTSAPPDTEIEIIAGAFRQKLPGILYQFFIGADGTIYQTQPLHQVVDGEKSYIANAVNIAFAGDFNETIPSSAQIESGGRLIAWLLGELPHLTLERVRGVSEFIPHGSPGAQWQQGQNWKDLLLEAARRASRPEPELESTQEEPVNTLRVQRLQERNDALQGQLQGVRQESERLRREVDDLRADPKRWTQVAQPTLHNVVDRLPRHPSLRYETRRPSALSHVAVHHTALPPHVGPERIAQIHVNEDKARGKDAWPGIGYHYFVHADGRILQTQPPERIVFHVAGHNENAVGVAFAGSFINRSIPTPQQLSAGARLIAWLLQEHNLPLSVVWGHQEFPGNSTLCPGNEWLEGRKWRDTLYEEIVRVQSGVAEKPIYHYLLLGQNFRPGAGADTLLHRAGPYLEQFRPSLGLSVDDAMQASYVTILGDETGVSGEAEEKLREAGAQVERIESADPDEVGRTLEVLAEEGRRFLNLEES